MPLLDELRAVIDSSAVEKKKTSTFHSLVLVHAADLEGIGADEVCRRLGMQKTWETEFSKMISIYKRLAELGYSIQKSP